MTMKPLYAMLLGLGFACAGAQAQSQYSITDLSTLTPGNSVYWQSINNAGDLAGIGSGAYGLMSYVGGRLTSLPYYPSDRVVMGNNGTLLFNVPTPQPEFHGTQAYALRNGVAEHLPLYSAYGENYVTAINNAGLTVGSASGDPRCNEWGNCRGDSRAVIFGDGAVTVLGTLNGHSESVATAVNNHGTIVGFSGNSAWGGSSFIYENGTMRNLGVGDDVTVPVAINDAGWVAGTEWLGAGGDGSWLVKDGQVEHFTLPGAGARVIDLNNAGELIGDSGPWGEYRAWIRVDGKITMLDELLHEDGWSVLEVYDLNDMGQIVASVRRPDGEYVFAVLTPDEPPVLLPVPEPGTYAMLMVGLGMVAWVRRRRDGGQ